MSAIHDKNTAGLQLFPTDHCLLKELRDQLLQLNNDEMSRTLVVLPTQRLATYLLTMMAQKRSSFFSPQIHTIDSFLSQRHTNTVEQTAVASTITQELLLCSLIKLNNYRYIRIGHAHEIKQFYSDLQDLGLQTLGFERLNQIIADNFFQSEDQAASLSLRFQEMEDLQSKFYSALATVKLDTKAISLEKKVNYLLKWLENENKLPYHWAYFSCFTTLKPCIQKLFKRFSELSNCSILLSSSPKLFGKFQPLTELAQSISQSPIIVKKNTEKIATPCRVHRCNNIINETAEAIHLVESYIENGYAPSEIAILLANERLHGNLVRSFIAQRQINANMAISLNMRQSTSGSWITSLSNLSSTQESAEAILSFATHPMSVNWLNRNIPKETPELAHERSQFDKLATILSDNICRQTATSGLSAISKNCEQIEAQHALNLLHDICKTFLHNNKQRYPLKDWASELRALADEFNIFENPPFLEDPGLKASISTGWKNFIADIEETCAFNNPLLSLKDFWQFTLDRLLSIDIRSVGYPLKGIQVLKITEARYIPYKVAIILGCTEGNFPQALPSDNLVDDWLKSRIGLPGWQYVESLEDTTFHLLLSRLPQVELFYADEEKMETTVRSRFIESLLCQDKAELIHHSSTKNLESFFFLSEKESTIAQYDTFSSFGDYPYPRANFIKKTSATSLKKLITCPYHFLMSKLDLQKLGMPDDSRNKNEGEYLHKIVEVFFTGSLNQKKIIDPLDPDNHAIEDLKKIFLQRLKFLTDEILPEEYISSPLYFHLIRYAWPQYAEHLTKLLSHTPLKKPVGSYKEFKLGNYLNSHNSTTHILNYPITIIGSIDSIDRFSEGYILTDYKRKYVEDPISVRKGIAPQLLLYAKAISELQQPELRLPLKDGIFGYWSILNGEWKSQAVGENAREWGLSLGLITKKTPSIEELINNLDSLWQWRIQSIFNNKENFYPETDKRWCSLCDYKGVCRLDDPKFKEIIEDNSRLNKKLEEQFALKN